jgi:hypothetical protein
MARSTNSTREDDPLRRLSAAFDAGLRKTFDRIENGRPLNDIVRRYPEQMQRFGELYHAARSAEVA